MTNGFCLFMYCCSIFHYNNIENSVRVDIWTTDFSLISSNALKCIVTLIIFFKFIFIYFTLSGTIGKCSAAAYFMDTDNKHVCQILQCDPPEKCLWSPGTPGKFAGFIRFVGTMNQDFCGNLSYLIVSKWNQ